MSNEIELKLVVAENFADFLSREITNFRILTQQKIFLGNCYYDTDTQFFAKHKMGLRVRQENGQFTLTLKSNGNVIGGLHIRSEYNLPLDDSRPNLSDLVKEYNLDDSWQYFQLQPVFATDFERRLWLIECGNGIEIEITLDQGEIVAGECREPICEVEFELKNGRVDNLLNFVKSLTLENNVRLSSVSKAQRGYRLARQSDLPTQDWLDNWRDFLYVEQQTVNAKQKLTALFKFEQDLIEQTIDLGRTFFVQDFLFTAQHIGTFFNLYHFYTENAQLIENALHQQIKKGWSNSDQHILIEVLESNARLLTYTKEIIHLHCENKNNLQAVGKLVELLQSGQYVKRMINLIFLTID